MLFNNEKKSNTHKFQTMMISLAIAIGVWLMVVYINDPSIKINLNNVDVRFSGEAELREKGLVVTGKNDIPSVSVSVSGKRSDLIDYMDNVYAVVGVDEIDKTGTYELPVTIDMPTAKLNLYKSKTNKLKVNIEPVVSKTVQITSKYTGTNKSYLIKSDIEDKEIQISGAQSEVEKIAYGAVIIDVASIQNVSEDNYSYSFFDKNGNPISQNTTIEASKTVIHVKNIPYLKASLKIVPVLSNELNGEYMLDEATTTVSPSAVEAGISDEFHGTTVNAVVDSFEQTENEYYLSQTNGLYIPEGSNTVRIKPSFLRKKRENMKLNIEAKNIPENRTADFAQTVNVTVECAENVTAEDITAEIDLKDLTLGTHRVPVTISGTNIAKVPYTEIDVTIK